MFSMASAAVANGGVVERCTVHYVSIPFTQLQVNARTSTEHPGLQASAQLQQLTRETTSFPTHRTEHRRVKVTSKPAAPLHAWARRMFCSARAAWRSAPMVCTTRWRKFMAGKAWNGPRVQGRHSAPGAGLRVLALAHPRSRRRRLRLQPPALARCTPEGTTHAPSLQRL